MSTETQKGHPKGLYLLFLTEMWERFSYYGMRAIFTLFMVNALLFDKTLASTVYGNYTGLVYLTPLIGGYVADRYWGNRRSILFGGLMMAVGQFFMFLSGTFYQEVGFATTLMFVGLGFLIFGNGFFKPNISTMVGQLYKEGDKRVDSAFTIFYMGINLGAFFAPFVTGTLGEVYDANGLIVPAAFKWGFLAACIGMIISTITFELLKNKYIVTPDGDVIGGKPEKVAAPVEVDKEIESIAKNKINVKSIATWLLISVGLFVFFKGILAFDLIGAFIYTSCLVAPASIITDKSLTKVEKDRIWVIFIIAFFVIFFWSAFEQAGASLTYFAQEQTDRTLFGWEVPSSYFQSINAVAIVIFAPIFAIIWTKLGKSNREPSSPVKQSIGLFLLALGYLIIAVGVKGLEPGVKVSMMWLITLYMIHTFGELCLSPIGLSMVTKLAPVRFASLLMGVWFLSTATANKFAGDLSKLYPEDIKMENSYNLAAVNLNDYQVDLSKETILKHVTSNLGVLDFKLEESVHAAKELSFGESFMKNLFGGEEAGVQVASIHINNESQADLSDYQKKLSIAPYREMDHVYEFNKDHSKMYVIKSHVDIKTKEITTSLEEWNLNPVKPSFLGFQITSLYHFFLIFVVLAGIASVILFLLSSKLNKMMHGVR
jgi:POT family proton-dependent oligopeptide transporter